jgi:hypothetical protein
VAGLPAELIEDRVVAVLRAASLRQTRDIVTAPQCLGLGDQGGESGLVSR